MANTDKSVLLLFQRPFEPVFTPRDNGKAVFDLPDNYYTERYKNIGQEISTRFGADNIEQRVSFF